MRFFRRKNKSQRSGPAVPSRRFVRRLPLSLELLEGRILLSADTWMAGSGNWDVGSNWSLGNAPGTGDTAIVNTSSTATITIQSGDNIQIQGVSTGSNDTLSITGGSLTVTSGSSTLSGPLSMTGGSVTASGSGVSLMANGSTTASGVNLSAMAGATLSLPQLTSFAADNSTFQADGSGSVLDLSALATTTITGAWDISVTSGAALKLNKLSSLKGEIAVTDTGNSTLSDGSLGTLDGVEVTLDGTDAQVANSWKQFTNGTLDISGGSFNLPGLTDFDDSVLNLTNGASMALPGLTKCNAGAGIQGEFSVDGSGGVLDLSALTTVQGDWFFNASNGGEIKLTGLTSLGNAGAGDIDTLQETSGSTLLDSNLTSLDGVRAFINSDAKVANSWKQFTNGDLNIDGGSYTLPGLTDIDGSSLNVAGGSLSLPGLVSFTTSNPSQPSTFQVGGKGDVLDLSALTTTTISGTWFLTAEDSGEVKLTGLTSLSGSGNGGIRITDNSGGTILDSNVTTLDGVVASLDGTDSQVANSWTSFSNGNLGFQIAAAGVTVTLPKLTDLSDSFFSVGLNNGDTLSFPMLTSKGAQVSMPAAGTSGGAMDVSAFQGMKSVFVTLQNSGTLTDTTVDVGQGSNVTLFNSGTLTDTTFNVGQGAKVSLSGGTYLGTTTFNVDQGATVDLTDEETTNYGGTLTGSGGGTVLLGSGDLSPTVGGLTLNFSGNTFQWTGGAFFASLGNVTNQGTMNLASGGEMGFFEDGTLFNDGTMIQTGDGNLDLHSDNVSPTTFINEAGAFYLIDSDGGIDNRFGGQVAVQNVGTIRKTSGTGTSQLFINGSLSNTGTIEADSGTLYLDANSISQLSSNTLSAGTWSALNGAALEFPSGSNITSNEANISLDSSGATFGVSSSGTMASALAGLSSNSGGLSLTNGATLTTTSDLSNSGDLTIGPDSTLNVGGKFSQTSAGTLNVQVGDSSSSLFGRVAVSGAATLGGDLKVGLPSGFTVPRNAAYTVMTFASASGTFAKVTGLGSSLAEQLSPTQLALQNGTGTAVDLQLSQVTAPTTATTGQSITANWQVSNSGSTTASGNWQDSVYLSTSPTITADSILLGSVTHSGGLAAGSSYKTSLTAAVPAVPPGNYYVLVQADSLGQLFLANRGNDIVATTGQLAVSVPALALAKPSQGTFTAADQDQYYQVTVPAGGSLQVTLTSAASSGALALYVSQGTQPTPSSFQESASVIGQPNQSLNVPVMGAGTYYILVHSVSGAAATAGYTLSITQTSSLSVSASSSYAGGNAGNVTIEIDGANFTPQTTAKLTLGGTAISTSTVYYFGASQLFATFNLSGAAVGGYTLSVQQGTQSATASKPFQVVAAPSNNGQVSIHLGVPQFVRAGRTGTVLITYTNTSNNDVVAPLLGVSSSNAKIFFSTPDDPNDFLQQAQVLAVDPNGPAGILRPGQSGQLTLTLQSQGTGGTAPIEAVQLAQNQTIDWSSLKSSLQPDQIPTAAWNVIFGNLTATLGTTTGSYNAALAQAATYLSTLGEASSELSDVGTLWSFLLSQADGVLPSSTLQASVDADLLTPGSVQLALDRTFLSPISSRYTTGIFGLGWGTSWQTLLHVASNGNVAISSGGFTLLFLAQPNGTYLDIAGEYGTLTKSGSGYTYTDTTGTQSVFLANGFLSYQQDSNGNRITLAYNAQNQLASLTYSNPSDKSEPTQQIALTYNGQGFVSQAADGTGNTWAYSYDSSGHLVSVSAPGNLTTTYTYDTGGNPETANALLSIANPDGSQVNYTYDPATGRLTGTSQNGGANAIAYIYDGESEVTAKDAAGNQTIAWFNDRGQMARVQNPTGGVSSYAFDINSNVIGYTDPAGGVYHYGYDTNGNLTQIVNPLGQTVAMTYGPLDTLTSLTNADGTATRYSYDTSGNLLKIAYPDNTNQSFTYDPLGNLSDTVLQNGDATAYQYNAQGQITKAAFADGTSQSFTYDAHGNLLTANSFNSSGTLTGTTKLTYNTADELLSIKYPNGQSLTFTYNAQGQRTKSVDQNGYTLNYSYDSLGRLSKLTDGSGNLIIQYTYTNIGQLAKKINGNGTNTTYAYDADGNLSKVVNYANASDTTVNSSFTYTYNVLDEQTSVTDAADKVTKYGYDALGQLTQVTLPDGTTISYVYNAAGDRTQVLTNGTPTSYSSNSDNEVVKVGSTTYTYDKSGNLNTVTDGSGTTTYTYNDQNQLVSIAAPDGTTTMFQYSPLGFLVGTSTTSGGTTSQTNYLVDPSGLGNVVASYNGSGALIADYNYGLGLVSQTGPSGTGYYDFDATGNTVGITGSSGSYVNRYSYRPFGETTTVSAALPNPFQYGGQMGIMTSASGLDFMRGRFYVTSTGQFASNDPLNLDGGDSNLRRYAGNSPVSFVDPTGQNTFSVGGTATLGAGVGGFYSFNLVWDGSSWLPDAQLTIGAGVEAGVNASGSFGYQYTNAPSAQSLLGPGQQKGWSAGEGPTVGYDAVYGNGYKGGGWSGGWSFKGTPTEGHKFKTQTWSLSEKYQNVKKRIYTYFTKEGTKPPPVKPPGSGGSGGGGGGGGVPGKPVQTSTVSTVASHDPNALYGPAGKGLFVLSGALSYRLEFENDGSAPALVVTASEQLDSDLDWTTFQLGSFGFGPANISVPAGLTEYQTTASYQNTDGSSLDVKANINFNVQTGLLTISFTSIDPLTGQPPDGALDGFLPPDNSSGIGEGFVQYTVQPKSGLVSGTSISGQASVVFDTNPPLQTQTVVNKLDTAPPTSSVGPLPPTVSSPSFTVGWSGSDPNGPGIASYNVYVSDNGGAFTPWQTNTTKTSATYNGQLGHHYGFYSVATDALGLIQPTPTAAQAMTNVGMSSPPPAPPPSPPPSSPPAPASPPASARPPASSAPPASRPPATPPALQVPPLLALLNSLLGGVEIVNSNGTETVTDSLFGIPLFVSTFNGAGVLESVTLLGIDITLLFE